MTRIKVIVRKRGRDIATVYRHLDGDDLLEKLAELDGAPVGRGKELQDEHDVLGRVAALATADGYEEYTSIFCGRMDIDTEITALVQVGKILKIEAWQRGEVPKPIKEVIHAYSR